MAVVPARRRAIEPDPIVVLAGGPGQGAIALASQVAVLFSRLNDARDIVLIDQRGTGGSHPLECEDDGKAGLQAAFEDVLPEKMVQECLRHSMPTPSLRHDHGRRRPGRGARRSATAA
ncbi:MAG: hypothetical protein IPH30_17555 [Betaproteobacteria bacterium]|nr:hypothetical protein [Betaproteobacteria bacterium]